ncbi:MAG: nucleotide sugar dehydrogenase [Paracoccus sp. (in: a-proteobacteria)]|uniref:nucleotide sugar dehydrogenase n=1 Tax=Paracoccus sp. TaxID=267 RepID=UPI0026DEC776|nr:nucleotide sugar dehydrogenase [Paracoccus sp. (in: a-proteobacteria)]MDO5631740.1 nucleotide sugar dehydrogenase [Paracoccus sp. (in: a-proteobacteria)]
MNEAPRIAIIGLGYVGLPLAVEFGKHFDTIGFDISELRVAELRAGTDRTGEVDDLSQSPHLRFASAVDEIRDRSVYIIAVPTPIDGNHRPDLTPLIRASETVGQVLGKGDVVIFESTVYPGATEEDCVPVLERVSGLRFNEDFHVGYSPERINPGDKARPLPMIVKVTSGSTPAVADFVDGLYRTIITAGTFKASSIRVAEAAKVIENTQRDVNIALINKLAMVFARLGIDTSEVIDAAATKWNFMRLKPGLVGGHCIGVDPYYLLHRAEKAGHIPDIIRIAREINNGMPREVARRLVQAMIARDMQIRGAHVLVLGATFKENCPDIRNTKVVDLIATLRDWGLEVDLTDPEADPSELAHEYGVTLTDPQRGVYDAIILAVAHNHFVSDGPQPLRDYLRPGGVFFDMKAAFPTDQSDLRL